MIRKWISLFLVCVMLTQLLSGAAFAFEYTAEDGIIWDFQNGILTISGTGPMQDYTYNEEIWSYDTPWIDVVDRVKQVVIEDGVTSIGANAFVSMYSLEKVTIGSGVTSISEGVFSDCTYRLAEIAVASGNNAYCSEDGVLFNKDKTELIQYPALNAQSDYTVPSSVETIADYAFLNCNNLTSVTLPDDLETIGDNAFYNCRNLRSIALPARVKSIGKSAFYYCENITEVDIPDSMTVIEGYAFSNTGLTEVTIPDNVKTVGN